MRLKPSPAWALVILSVVYAVALGGPLPDVGGGRYLSTPSVSVKADLNPVSANQTIEEPLPVEDSQIQNDYPSDSEELFEAASEESPLMASVGGPDESSLDSGALEGVTSEDAPTEESQSLVFEHVVQRGETLWDIAKLYGIDVNTILSANELINANRLSVGDKLNILRVKGALHTVQNGESLWDIARKYRVEISEIVSVNELSSPERLQPRQRLVIPGAEAASLVVNNRSVVSASGRLQRVFQRPVKGGWISSTFGERWGRMHEGLDIAVNTGTSVKAAAAGRVTYAGWNGGYGLLVKIDHGNNVETRYGHNSQLLVKVGQVVTAGQRIALSGNTGNSTGPHLHFEIRLKGVAQNPQLYLE